MNTSDKIDYWVLSFLCALSITLFISWAAIGLGSYWFSSVTVPLNLNTVCGFLGTVLTVANHLYKKEMAYWDRWYSERIDLPEEHLEEE